MTLLSHKRVDRRFYSLLSTISLLRNMEAPGITFYKTTYGKNSPPFQAAWFTRYPWLHYDVFCFTFAKAHEIGILLSSKAELKSIEDDYRICKLVRRTVGSANLKNLKVIKIPVKSVL